MVGPADCLLAAYDDVQSIRSGTGMAVNYAKKAGKPIKDAPNTPHQNGGYLLI